MLKKIVILGPESTGKSTLCQQLAAHYNTSWCPEYAREYLLSHGTNYSYEELLTIAKGQLDLEDEFISELSSPISHAPHPARLFIDTNMYVMKVWCEFVFSNCHRFILDKIVERKYDLYLLCNIDLSWVKDKLREYPNIQSRQKLYSIYKDIMINQTVPWVVISGNHDERLKRAINAIDNMPPE